MSGLIFREDSVIDKELKPGDQVIVKDGPLKSLTGIFEQELKHTREVVILLQSVTYQAHLVLKREHIERQN